MSSGEVSIIEKSRPLKDNEFVFYDQVVIRDEILWELFDYISSISNIKITKMDNENIISRRSSFNNAIALRIDMKDAGSDEPF